MPIKEKQSICTLCWDDVVRFQKSRKGWSSDKTKFMFVLHKPDTRVNQNVLAFSDRYDVALSETKTGKELVRMLKYNELSIDDIYLTNLFKCVLKGDRNPKVGEYKNCMGNFRKELQNFNPEKMVLFGSTTFKVLFPGLAEIKKHEELWGQKRFYMGIPTLMLPHPSKSSYFSQERRINEFYEPLKEFLGL